MSVIPESIGKYRVIRRLGEGGMGTVYLAHDDGIDRDVAIKLLRADDEGLRRMFRAEAQSAGRLKHPNIVTVYEYGEFQDEPYLVMEYIEGQTLAQLRDRNHDLASRLSLLIQACKGLAYAHRFGVVHRDIKPSNLMVDNNGDLKIVDFGIARTSGRDLTVTGKVVGTPAYMAPEQLQGSGADARSDIFALGLVVFEVLSGECAFTGDSDYAIINRIVNGAANPFRHPLDPLGPLIQPVIDKALSKDPAARYQSADVLGEELARVRVALETGMTPEVPQVGLDAAPTILLSPAPQRSRLVRRGAVAAAVTIAIATIGVVGIYRPFTTSNTAPQAQPVEAAVAAAPAAIQPAPATVEPKAPAVPAASPESAAPAPAPKTADVRHTAEPAVSPLAPLLSSANASLAAADYDTASARFNQVLARDPDNAAATEGLATVRRAIERGRVAGIKIRIADAEQKLLDGAYDDAMSIFESILKTDATNPEALDGVSRARRAKAAEEAFFKPRTKKPSGGK